MSGRVARHWVASSPRLWLQAACALAAVVVGMGGAVVPAFAGLGDGTPAPQGFAALASAEGARVTETVPGYLVVETLVDGGAPVAQATLESSGLARSFASMPYPGDTVIAAPGLIASFGGPSLPVSFPTYVSADCPVVPKQETSDPTGQLELKATADPAAAGGLARLAAGVGPQPASQSRAETTVTRGADGTVTARADSLVEGLSFSDGLLRIGTVHSSATTVLKPGASKPTSTSDLAIDGLTVAGQRVGVGPTGITLLGQTTPVPSDLLDNLQKALTGAGISLRLVRETLASEGVASDGLEITMRHTTPVPGNPESITVVHLGAARSSITVGAGGVGVAAVGASTSGGASELGALGSPPATAPEAAGATAPGEPTASVVPASAAVGGTPGSNLTGTVAQTSAALPVRALPTRALRDLRSPTELLYLVLAIGGVIGLFNAWTLRSKGVQSTWTL